MTTLLTPPKIANLRKLVKLATTRTSGHVAELGVYKGGSAKIILESCNDWRAVYLFDTFEGLPKPGPTDGPVLKEGGFAAPLSEVYAEFDGVNPNRLHFEVGVFPDSAYGLESLRFAFVHVDVDLAASVTAACEWFFPRMNPGGIVLFDDYGCPQTPGAKPALVQYCQEHSYTLVDLGTRQAMVEF